MQLAMLDAATYAWNPLAIPLLATATALLALGALIAARERGSRVSVAFLGLVGSVGLWLLMFSAMYCAADERTALQCAKLAYLGIPFIPAAVYQVAVSVLQPVGRSLRLARIGWLLGLLFSISIIGTDRLIRGVTHYWWGYYPRYGWLSVPYLVFFFFLLGAGLRLFWVGYRSAKPGSMSQRRLRCFLRGFCIASIASVDYLAKYGIPLYPFGYMPVLIFLGMMAWTLLRYRLADITPALAAVPILRQMSEPLVVVDADGIVRLANRAACDLLDAAESSLCGEPLAAVFGDPRLDAWLRARVEGGAAPDEREVRHRLASGEVRVLQLLASAVRTSDQRLVALTCFLRDLTSRRRAEAAFARIAEAAEDWKQAQQHARPSQPLCDPRPADAALRQLSFIVESSRDAVIGKRLDGTIFYWNQGAERLYGYASDEVKGRSSEFLDPPEAPYRMAEVLAEVARGKPMYLETVLRRKDGTLVDVAITLSPIKDAASQVVGISTMSHDITARKRTDAALRRAHEQLQRSHQALKATQLQLIQAAKLESVGRLAAGVAHEVKNPLAVIFAGVEYLTKALASSDGRVSLVLADMHGAIGRADAVVKGLLNFSVLRELAMQPEDLGALIDQSLLLVKHDLDRSRVAVVKQFAADLPRVEVDRSKMEQVFVNLFMNAIQAMPDSGALTITTSMRRMAASEAAVGQRQTDRFHPGEDAIVVEVDDTGSGIPPATLSRIFDPFFTTKPVGQGTGLGLTVTRRIIDLHRGAIEISNRPQGGVRATVFLHEKGAEPDDPCRRGVLCAADAQGAEAGNPRRRGVLCAESAQGGDGDADDGNQAADSGGGRRGVVHADDAVLS